MFGLHEGQIIYNLQFINTIWITEADIRVLLKIVKVQVLNGGERKHYLDFQRI